MAIGLPNIDIVFIQKAVSAVLRSERGTAVIIVKDDKQQQQAMMFLSLKRILLIKNIMLKLLNC